MGFWKTMTRAGCQCEDVGNDLERTDHHRCASHSLFRIAIMMRSLRLPSASR
jgi:hypothetical protein